VFEVNKCSRCSSGGSGSMKMKTLWTMLRMEGEECYILLSLNVPKLASREVNLERTL